MTQQTSRFKLYSIFNAFTFIVLIAIAQVETDVEAQNNLDDKTGKYDKGWALALSILSFFITSATLGVYLHNTYRGFLTGTYIEGLIILVLLMFATTIVALVTGPQKGLAVDADGAVFVGNMYYFAWAAFSTCVLIVSSFLEESFGFNVAQEMRLRSTSFSYWSALLITSLVVMASSADLYNRNCDAPANEKPQPFCSRSVLGVIVGVIGVVFSLAIVVMKVSFGAAPFLTEVSLCLSLFVFYLVEIAYVTDIDGPGSPLGNLYYFSWFSFLLTFMVGKACYEDYVDLQHSPEEQPHQQNMGLPPLPDDDDDSVGGMAVGGRVPNPSVGGTDVGVIAPDLDKDGYANVNGSPTNGYENGRTTMVEESVEPRRRLDDDDLSV